jgi:hypothetical protein
MRDVDESGTQISPETFQIFCALTDRARRPALQSPKNENGCRDQN